MTVDNRSVGPGSLAANAAQQTPEYFVGACVVKVCCIHAKIAQAKGPSPNKVLQGFFYGYPTGADTELGQLNGTARFPPSNEVLMVRVTGSVKTGMRNCWVRSENPLVASRLAPLDRKADVSIAAPYGLYS